MNRNAGSGATVKIIPNSWTCHPNSKVSYVSSTTVTFDMEINTRSSIMGMYRVISFKIIRKISGKVVIMK
jgi:hypothetical protein